MFLPPTTAGSSPKPCNSSACLQNFVDLWILAAFYISISPCLPWKTSKCSLKNHSQLILELHVDTDLMVLQGFLSGYKIQLSRTFSQDSTWQPPCFCSSLSMAHVLDLIVYWTSCPQACWQGSPLNYLNTPFLDVWRWGVETSRLSWGPEAGRCWVGWLWGNRSLSLNAWREIANRGPLCLSVHALLSPPLESIFFLPLASFTVSCGPCPNVSYQHKL